MIYGATGHPQTIAHAGQVRLSSGHPWQRGLAAAVWFGAGFPQDVMAARPGRWQYPDHAGTRHHYRGTAAKPGVTFPADAGTSVGNFYRVPQRIVCPGSSGNYQFTFAAFVNATAGASGSETRILGAYSGSGEQHIACYYNSSTKRLQVGIAGVSEIDAGIVIPQGRWTLAIWSLAGSGSTGARFLASPDSAGKETYGATSHPGGEVNTSCWSKWVVGGLNYSGDEWWRGSIMAAMIWTRGMVQAEMRQLARSWISIFAGQGRPLVQAAPATNYVPVIYHYRRGMAA
jgi:hypothetical protein